MSPDGPPLTTFLQASGLSPGEGTPDNFSGHMRMFSPFVDVQFPGCFLPELCRRFAFPYRSPSHDSFSSRSRLDSVLYRLLSSQYLPAVSDLFVISPPTFSVFRSHSLLSRPPDVFASTGRLCGVACDITLRLDSVRNPPVLPF